MKVTLLDVFDDICSDVVFNDSLASKMHRYQIGYINSDKDYLTFFAGNLLGVQPVRFKDTYILTLYEEVLDIDFLELSRRLLQVTDLNQDFKISSDVFNLTLMYVLHRFTISKDLKPANKDLATTDTALVFFYRTIAALIANGFKYTADPKLVQTAYSKLSNKYLIKRLGTWHKYMVYRAEDLVGKKGIHRQTIGKFDRDLDVVYLINDSQGRVRDTFKSYYSVIMETQDEGLILNSTSSSMVDIEGESVLRDRINSVDNSLNYLRTTIHDEHAFIQQELLTIITAINSNSSISVTKDVLTWIFTNYENPKYSKQIAEFLNLIVIVTNYIVTDKLHGVKLNDYSKVLATVKANILSSRTTDKDLLKLRELGVKIFRHSKKGKVSDNLLYSTRTAVILYVFFRLLIGTSK